MLTIRNEATSACRSGQRLPLMHDTTALLTPHLPRSWKGRDLPRLAVSFRHKIKIFTCSYLCVAEHARAGPNDAAVIIVDGSLVLAAAPAA